MEFEASLSAKNLTMSPPLTASNEEPRYDGVDLQVNQIRGEPSTSRVNEVGSAATSSTACTSSSYSNIRGDSSFTDTKLTHGIDDLIAQIDPPEGFQPDGEPNRAYTSNHPTQPPPNEQDKVHNSASTPTSSVSSSLSLSSSSNAAFNFKGTHDRRARCSRPHIENDTHGNASSSNTNTTSSTRSRRSTGGGAGVLETDGVQVGTQNNHNKEYEPTPSTSTQRIVNGINSIVTKISKAFHNASLPTINTDSCLQEEVPKFAFGHKRTLEKTWKLMDKVVKCCQRPRMNLNNSPPFILEILPETYQHLKLIYTKYGATKNFPVNDNEYSQVFLRNLQNRCKQTLKLFKDAKGEMFDVDSEYRHKLTRNTLVFNHILSELKAIFPHGQFVGEKYLITKKEGAGEFWRNSFGCSVLVDWKSFYHALQKVHSIDSSFFSLHALKQTIDLTCDDYISIFEFDVFTRLFQPWSTLLVNWQILAVTHPGYKAFLTYDELKARLQKHIDKPGSYVYRLSCTKLGQWAIGYVTPDKQILQTIVQNISLSQALTTENKVYLYPDGKDEDPSLGLLCSGMASNERNVTVTEEQYEIYCGVGNSFQTCKICFENDKNIRVEPCNHLLCTKCLEAWQRSEGQGCPYCRTEIKETVQITMNLPKADQ